MKRRAVLVLVTGFMLAAIVEKVQAGPPPYLLLRVQAAPIPRPTTDNRCLSADSGPPAQPYAYGWFGVPSRQHWSRHFGYYRNYTQWSGK